jgi:tetracycline resistance efflux pump
MESIEFEAPDGQEDLGEESLFTSVEGNAIDASIAQIKKPFYTKRNFIHYSVLVLFFAIITFITPYVLPSFPLFSILPALFLLVYIFLTRRIFESLSLGIVLAFLMTVSANMYVATEAIYGFEVGSQLGFFDAINYSLIKNVANEDTAWLFIVCGLMGSFVAIIEQAGGVYAFGRWVAKRAKTEKSTLLWTWVLGLIIFVDDYLNALTVGSSMAPLTDEHKVSREYLAYIVDSTAAPDTTLIPVSTWAVFIAGLYTTTISDYGLTDIYGGGIRVFISSIPFNFYGWFSLLIVPLTILGVIPMFGKMKRAEKRAKETGVLAPPGSEKIDIRAGELD